VIKYALPEIYHQILPGELLQAEISETKATCQQCNWKEYQSHLKCCTYEPYLPNYLVGALFENPATSPEVLQILREKIRTHQYSLPIGMTASVRYQVQFNHREVKDFGNREDWLCPYYDRKNLNCGIWRSRGAVCTTYYCLSSYGKSGIRFWEKLSDYLTYVEMALMEDVMVEMGYSPRELSECLAYINCVEGTVQEMKNDYLSEKQAKKLWGHHFSDQENFFRQSYRQIKQFDKKKFRQALGEAGADVEESLFDDLRKLI
jgi:Fe-S-cluster containining protein